MSKGKRLLCPNEVDETLDNFIRDFKVFNILELSE